MEAAISPVENTVKATTKSRLAEIEAFLNRNLVSQAMEGLLGLLRGLPYEELSLARPDIEGLIDRFLPKRRRDLLAALDVRVRGGSANTSTGQGTSIRAGYGADRKRSADPIQPLIPKDPESKALEYAVRFNTLRDKHIFQWNTAYRDTINYVFKDMVASRDTPEEASTRARVCCSALVLTL